MPSRNIVARYGAVVVLARGKVGKNTATMPPRAGSAPLIDIAVGGWPASRSPAFLEQTPPIPRLATSHTRSVVRSLAR